MPEGSTGTYKQALGVYADVAGEAACLRLNNRTQLEVGTDTRTHTYLLPTHDHCMLSADGVNRHASASAMRVVMQP